MEPTAGEAGASDDGGGAAPFLSLTADASKLIAERLHHEDSSAVAALAGCSHELNGLCADELGLMKAESLNAISARIFESLELRAGGVSTLVSVLDKIASPESTLFAQVLSAPEAMRRRSACAPPERRASGERET